MKIPAVTGELPLLLGVLRGDRDSAVVDPAALEPSYVGTKSGGVHIVDATFSVAPALFRAF